MWSKLNVWVEASHTYVQRLPLNGDWMAEILWNAAYEVAVLREQSCCSIPLCNQGFSKAKVSASCSALVTFFCSSGESNSSSVYYWHVEVLLKEGRLISSYSLAYTLTCYLVLRQVYLAASRIKGNRRDCILAIRETDPRLEWLQEQAEVMQKLLVEWGRFFSDWHSRNMHKTGKIFPQKHPLHSSTTLHSYTALCWSFPGTPISPPNSDPACTLLQHPHLCHSFNPSHNPNTFCSFSTEVSSRDDRTWEVQVLARHRESQESAGPRWELLH